MTYGHLTIPEPLFPLTCCENSKENPSARRHGVDQALACGEKGLEDGLILCAARAAGCGIIVTRGEKALLGFEGHKVDERGCLALLAASEGKN